MVASGQTSRSVAVSAPGPHPRSTTVRTSVARTRSTRSRNGRARSSAYVPYCSGFHTGDLRIALHLSELFILMSRYSSPPTCLDVKSLDEYSRLMEDEVDRLIEAWRRERPDLDVAPMEVLSRVSRLARHLD